MVIYVQRNHPLHTFTPHFHNRYIDSSFSIISSVFKSSPSHTLKFLVYSLIQGDYIYITIFIDSGKFVKYDSKCHLNLSEKAMRELQDFLSDNIYVKFGNKTFRQEVGMQTNCVPFLDDLFLCI